MERNPTKFAREWNMTQKGVGGIKVMTLDSAGDLYGLEIRFPATNYECSLEDFADARDAISRRSGGTFRVSSSKEDFCGGILSIDVACANHAYTDEKGIGTMRMILTEIIPSFKKGNGA